MIKKLVIMSGVSGSGKDTYAGSLPLDNGHSVLLSADQFFTSKNGYKFDPRKLAAAHADCFRRFIEQVSHDWNDEGLPAPLVVVCNTNTEVFEIAPYYQAGLAFGWDTEMITLRCGSMDEVEMCARRNCHGVPEHVVFAQHERLERRRLPSHWENTVVWVK
jgi:hypothetical protein